METDEFRDENHRASGQSDGQAQERDDHVLHGEHFVRVLPVMVIGHRPERFGVHEPTVDDAALHEYGNDAVDDFHERHVPAHQIHDVKRSGTLVHDVQQHFVVLHVRAGYLLHQIVFPADRG